MGIRDYVHNRREHRPAETCDYCAGLMTKVIYMGLPGRMCLADDCCHLLVGLAAYAPPVATETPEGPQFAFMPYEGSYWVALWHWLFD